MCVRKDEAEGGGGREGVHGVSRSTSSLWCFCSRRCSRRPTAKSTVTNGTGPPSLRGVSAESTRRSRSAPGRLAESIAVFVFVRGESPSKRWRQCARVASSACVRASERACGCVCALAVVCALDSGLSYSEPVSTGIAPVCVFVCGLVSLQSAWCKATRPTRLSRTESSFRCVWPCVVSACVPELGLNLHCTRSAARRKRLPHAPQR